MRPTCKAGLAAFLLAVSTAAPGRAEIHLQYGQLLNPFSGAEASRPWSSPCSKPRNGSSETASSSSTISTTAADDGFNDREFYAEWYPTLSLGKLAGRDFRLGPIADFSLVAGFNASGDGKVVKYLPGLRASWNLPGFLFLNTDLTAYLDGNTGISGGGPPATGNSFLFDVNWVFPFEAGSQLFAIAGHAEYVGRQHRRAGRGGQLVDSRPAAVHLGPGQRGIRGSPHRILAGIEYQYWLQQAGNRPRREHGATAAGLAPLKGAQAETANPGRNQNELRLT